MTTCPPERFLGLTAVDGRIYALSVSGKVYVAERGIWIEVPPKKAPK
jgi:hypothetical protein